MKTAHFTLALCSMIFSMQLFATTAPNNSFDPMVFLDDIARDLEYRQRALEREARTATDPQARARANKALDAAQDQAIGIQGAVLGSITSSLGAAGEQRQSQIKINENNAKAEAYGNQIRQTISDPQVLTRAGLTVVSVVAGYFILKGSTQLVTKYLESQLGKPRLVQETSVVSPVSKILGATPKKPLSAGDIVLSSDQKKEFLDIVKATKFSKEHNTGFSHLLFYGPPGTGKTLSAKIISQISDLDYAIIAGSSFNQFEEGKDIQQLDKLIRWGKKSNKGLVLFIDEADSALGVRTGKNQRADNLVNYFLSNFERTSHEKIMLVFATNHIEKLDPAILSRVSKTVYVDLPAKRERVKQIELALEKVFEPAPKKNGFLSFFDWKKSEQSDVIPSAELKENAELIGDMTDGFTGRDLFDLASQFKRAAILNETQECSLELAMTEIEKSREKIKARQKIEKIQQNNGHAYFNPNL
ncbi:MAG: ATP-binding protein [Oligoflexales bacterium]